MTLPTHIADLEKQKFIEDKDGKPAVRLGPGAIQDADGNSLGLTDDGEAKAFDYKVAALLHNIHDTLEEIRIILNDIRE